MAASRGGRHAHAHFRNIFVPKAETSRAQIPNSKAIKNSNAAVVMSPYGALLKPPATPGDLYSGEKTTGYASGASGGSTPCRPSVMVAPALPWGRGGAAAPSERGGNYGQGRTVAHEPVLRVPRGAGTEAARATWRAGWGAWERPCRASGTMSGGPYGQGPDDVGEGPPRGHRRPRRVGHRGHVRRQSDGSRTGWRECPRRGPDGNGHRPVAAMPLS